MVSSIPTRATPITDPKTGNIVYILRVESNESWCLYPARNGMPDWANPITSLQNILDECIRQQAELELNKQLSNIRADKTFRNGW